MACWPSVISFFTSLVNTVLRLCSCFLRQFGEMLNFWHNSSRALDLRGLFLYSGPQVSHRHGCFSSSLHKSFLWASDIFSLINSQSWVSAFSTSTTSAMFTLPKSDMPEVKRPLTHHLTRVFGCHNLQHQNLLRDKLRARVVMRATTLFNLQRNNVARQVVRKCCPYYLTLIAGFYFSQTSVICFRSVHKARVDCIHQENSFTYSQL